MPTKPHAPLPKALLVNRKTASVMLGNVSFSTLKKLEAERRLIPVRLSRGPTAPIFYKRANLVRLVQELEEAEGGNHEG
jgi:hypothetical protein